MNNYRTTIIQAELTTEDALKLVRLIKSGSEHAGVLVMKSLANTLRYVTYTKVKHTWNSESKRIKIQKHQMV
jgi:hypothetical protein